VSLLLKSGAKLVPEKGVEVRNGANPLFFAVTTGDIEMTDVLLNAGAQVNSRMMLLGRIDTTAVLYAALAGDAAMVGHLIKKGADPNETDRDGISLLAWAALGNHLDTVKVLLANKANVNTVDKLGMTPLLYAASIDYGDVRVVEALIAGGADMGAKNKEGLTAVALAKGYKHPGISALLSSKPLR
jgi:ankyrin repeat protein